MKFSCPLHAKPCDWAHLPREVSYQLVSHIRLMPSDVLQRQLEVFKAYLRLRSELSFVVVMNIEAHVELLEEALTPSI
jgi:hypothetical protein